MDEERLREVKDAMRQRRAALRAAFARKRLILGMLQRANRDIERLEHELHSLAEAPARSG